MRDRAKAHVAPPTVVACPDSVGGAFCRGKAASAAKHVAQVRCVDLRLFAVAGAFALLSCTAKGGQWTPEPKCRNTTPNPTPNAAA